MTDFAFIVNPDQTPFHKIEHSTINEGVYKGLIVFAIDRQIYLTALVRGVEMRCKTSQVRRDGTFASHGGAMGLQQGQCRDVRRVVAPLPDSRVSWLAYKQLCSSNSFQLNRLPDSSYQDMINIIQSIGYCSATNATPKFPMPTVCQAANTISVVLTVTLMPIPYIPIHCDANATSIPTRAAKELTATSSTCPTQQLLGREPAGWYTATVQLLLPVL